MRRKQVPRHDVGGAEIFKSMNPLSELWAQQSYVRFLLARLSGLTANQMLMVAVAWHMYELT